MSRFSICDVLFLVVLIALALGWWLDRRPVPARFQLQLNENKAYVLDTATGQVWQQGGNNDFAPPKVTSR